MSIGLWAIFLFILVEIILVESPALGDIDASPASAASFVSDEGGIKRNVVEIWTINKDKNRAYQIEVSTVADKYSSFIPEHIMKMIESIEFL
ncbi:MAG: hypothetical protein ACM3ZS_02225 [Nitrososphaerota archaeon]